MRPNKRQPDYEAESAGVVADTISNPMTFRRSKDHHANRITAKGDVEIKVHKQHRGSKDDVRRPKAGETLNFPGKNTDVDIDARRVGKIDRGHGRHRTTVSKHVQIFRRSRRCPQQV